MSTNSAPKDIRTKAFVLRRTNYGEADRILNLITPQGKMSVIAKGVRKEKSKLAGNIEMFCLIDLNIHAGRSEFGVVTSAKMLEFYNSLISDFKKMELATLFIKEINRVSENSDSPEFFSVLSQAFIALEQGVNAELVESWFWFNVAKACGEEINLYRDAAGKKLEAETAYLWDVAESALREHPNGNINTDEIKIMRLMLTSKLETVSRVKNIAGSMSDILRIAKAVNKI